jgi:hypothetical protein
VAGPRSIRPTRSYTNTRDVTLDPAATVDPIAHLALPEMYRSTIGT